MEVYMIAVFNDLRLLSPWTIMIRFLFVVISAGVIGLERTIRHSTAGFRTHILICIGASITTMTGQYLTQCMGMNTDMTRIGAQVVAGVGFIGAGAIMTTGQRVRGLTTAAGLWTVAIIGLCYGGGFYEGGLIATLMVLFIESIFYGIERGFTRKTNQISLYVQYKGKKSIDTMQGIFLKNKVTVENLEFDRIEKTSKKSEKEMCAVIKVIVPNAIKPEKLVQDIGGLDGVSMVEIL